MPRPVDITTETVIDRSIDSVASFAADPTNAPLWYSNIKSVELQTPPPFSVGSQVTFVAHFLGRRLEYTYEVVECVAKVRLVMRTAQGPFPMETMYEWEQVGAGATRMRLRNHGMPSGFSKLAAPFMAHAMRSANRKDLARLKEVLESG